MSRRIAKLINEPEHLVTKLINELEDKNGNPSHDSRHIAENIQKIRLKIKDLGLDPDDTTAKEFYQALMIRFAGDSHRFEQFFGLENISLQQKLTAAVKLVYKYRDIPEHWALKSKAAKMALKTIQPKKLMKYLGYRSVDSMLKREDIYELYLAAHVIEPKNWQKNLGKYVSKLSYTDFETRPVKLVNLDYEKWSDIEPDAYVHYDTHIGAAGIWPSDDLQSAPILALVLMLAESFTPQTSLKPGVLAVKMNMVMWWADMDHLVAEMSGQHVSLNVKDCAYNHWLGAEFEHRILDQGQKNFWQELVSRYKNRPAVELPFENAIVKPLASLQSNIPEPVFEFAEEFDG